MKLTEKIIGFLKNDLWRLEPEALTGVRRAGLRLCRVTALVFKGFREDACPLHASALTFNTVMALVPTLVIAFAFAKGFGMDKVDKYVSDLLETPPAVEQQVGDAPEAEIVTETQVMAEGMESVPGPVDSEAAETQSDDPVKGYLRNMAANMPDELKQAVQQILNTVEQASVGALGSVSTVLFLWIMIKMLSRVEETFNLVWGVRTSRSMLDKVRNYVFVMAVAPALLILGSSAAPAMLALSVRLEWMLGPMSRLLAFMVPVLIMSVAFAVFYICLPNTAVRIGPAFSGALISALLVIVLQVLMMKLGVGVAKYNKIYGGLAALPIFLFWLQMSWMIMLFGAEISFAAQNVGSYRHELQASGASAYTRAALGVTLIDEIRRRFSGGEKPMSVDAFAEERSASVRLVKEVLSVLVRNGLITESGEHPDCFVLLKNPEQFSDEDVAEAILRDGNAPEEMGLREIRPIRLFS